MLKYFVILLIFTVRPLNAKKKAHYTLINDCVEVAGNVYHGTEENGYYNRDMKLVYEFNSPIKMSGLQDSTVFSRAKSLKIYYQEDKKRKSKYIYGNLKKPKRRSPKIKKE